MRPSGKARRGRIPSVCDRGATQPGGMQRRSNAAGLSPRAASGWHDGLQRQRGCRRLVVWGHRTERGAGWIRPPASTQRDFHVKMLKQWKITPGLQRMATKKQIKQAEDALTAIRQTLPAGTDVKRHWSGKSNLLEVMKGFPDGAVMDATLYRHVSRISHASDYVGLKGDRTVIAIAFSARLSLVDGHISSAQAPSASGGGRAAPPVAPGHTGRCSAASR